MIKAFLILTTVCFCESHADITKVTDMQEVFDYFHDADSKTLAIFDVDMVLVQPGDPAFQMANMKRYGAICKSILNEVPADKQMLFLSLMTIGSNPVLIDDRAPEFLQQIQSRGIPAMALTANLTGKFGPIPSMEDWRVDGLLQLGIDFSKTAPCQNPLVFDHLAPYRGNFSNYRNGILFVNGTAVSKGEAFLAYLEMVDFSPQNIIFIDDREDNLKSLETAIRKLDRPIEFQGLHYLGAQKYPSQTISEEEFTARWQQLASEAKNFD